MSGMIVPVTLKALFTRLYNTFKGVTSAPATDLSVLATEVPVTSSFATFAWLGAFPRFREWLGQRVVNGLAQRLYQMFVKDYELTIAIDRNSLDDNMLAEKNMVVQGMAEEAVNLPRDLIIDLLANGHARVAYDGQNFFDTDHPLDPSGPAGSQSNYESTGFALTRNNFIAARTRIRRFKNENGRVFGGRGRLKLVVPAALEQTAIDIVGVDTIAIAGGTQKNTLLGAADIIVVPELDDVSTTAWYLFEVGSMPPPMIMLVRQTPRFAVKDGPTDENVFWNKEYQFGADARYGAGYGAWFKAFKGVA
jgi:phage major head subunit gpT-like protein